MGLTFRKLGFSKAKALFIKRYGLKVPQIKRLLQWLGTNMANHARENGAYTDHSHNLRSSIGYRLYYLGVPVVEGGFEDKGGPQGVAEAKAALDRYEEENDIPSDGFTLVVVAGMYYAGYVEAKGYNVLHLTEIEMQRMIEKIKKDVLKSGK